MKTIALRGKRGGQVVVDDADFPALSKFKWYMLVPSKKLRLRRKKTGKYAARWKNGRPILMHREIMGAPRGRQVDHENHDGLDNRRSNLRLATNRDNTANSTRGPGTTGFRGVERCRGDKFRARAWINGKVVYGGTFDTAEEASRARDRLAIRMYGAFATLNFPVHDARKRAGMTGT